jgi:cytochrome bd-type quinol oxidase subunit 1
MAGCVTALDGCRGQSPPEEFAMVSWIVRIVMSLAAVITGWFVVEDSPNFGIFQMAVAVILIILFVAIIVFWTSIRSRFTRKRKPENP